MLIGVCILSIISMGVYFLRGQEQNYDQTVIENEKTEEVNNEKDVSYKENGGQEVKKVDRRANEKSNETEITPVQKGDRNNEERIKVEKDLKGLTEKAIEVKYKARLNALKSEFEGRLSGMIGQAKAEYGALSEKEKGKQRFSLVFKYLKKGNAMENECDGRVNKIIGDMEKELRANNFGTKLAKRAKAQYKQEKSQRRKALMKKAMGS